MKMNLIRNARYIMLNKIFQDEVSVGLNYAVPSDWFTSSQYLLSQSPPEQPTAPDLGSLVNFDPETYHLVAARVAQLLEVSFESTYVSPVMLPEKYFCLDYNLLSGNYWREIGEQLLVSHQQNLKVGIAMFVFDQYQPAENERTDEIEHFVCPIPSHLLQLVLHSLMGCELHLIHCPLSMSLKDFLTAYLQPRINSPISQIRACIFGQNCSLFHQYNEIPHIKVGQLEGCNSIVVVRIGIVILKEERAEMDMARIEDEIGIDVMEAGMFGENCPILDQNRSDVACGGDDRADMEKEWLDDIEEAKRNTHQEPVFFFQDLADIDLQNQFAPLCKNPKPQQIENFKSLSQTALQSPIIPVPSSKAQQDYKAQLESLVQQLLKKS